MQTAFYFNSELFHYADSSSSDIQQELQISFSNEWKWKVSKPFAKTGIALYGEWGIKGGDELELESKTENSIAPPSAKPEGTAARQLSTNAILDAEALDAEAKSVERSAEPSTEQSFHQSGNA